MARTSKKKSTSSSSGLREWFSHRQLLMLEAVLLVGLGKEMLEWLVLERSGLPPLARIALGMVVVVSTLGGLVIVAQRRLRRGIDRTHKAVRRRMPVPQVLLHGVFLAAIFVAYAAFWDQETGALDALAAHLVHLGTSAWAAIAGT